MSHYVEIASKLKPFIFDVFKFAKLLGIDPTFYQANLMLRVMKATHTVPGILPRFVTRSGQGTGKTAICALLALWRVLQAPGALVVVTAPTQRQARDIFLAEVKRWVDKSPEWLQSIIDVQGSKVVINGDQNWSIKTATATDPRKLQGWHQKYLTFIVEEASGVESSIFEVIRGTLSGPQNMLIAIGNPNVVGNAFHAAFHEDSDSWEKFHFDAELAALHYPHILHPQRNKDIADTYGIDSDVYRVRVKGDFPLAAESTVMSRDDIISCTENANMYRCLKMNKDKVFGWDVARHGGDESVVYMRSGNSIVKWEKFVHTEPVAMRRWMIGQQALRNWADMDCHFVVDVDGMGQGVVGDFYEMNKQVLEFRNNGTAHDSKMYDNKITEAYFSLAQRAKKNELYFPKDPLLIEQLTTRKYEIEANGRIRLEKKKEYVKRRKKEVGERASSPDRADALVMAFYPHVVASSQVAAA